MQDGSTEYEGRIEVRKNGGPWGLVCDDGFGIEDANVFCKMLGYTNGAETVYTNSHFGHGNLNYHSVYLGCTGAEESFLDCPANSWNSHNCGSGEAAGVKCYLNPRKYYNFRTVVNQTSPLSLE